MPGARPLAPGAGLRPPVQGTPARADGTMLPDQKKSGTPVLQDSFFNDADNSEQNILNSKPQEAAAAGKKVFALRCNFCLIHHTCVFYVVKEDLL